MRFAMILLSILLPNLASSQEQKGEAAVGGALAKKADKAAFAFADSVAMKDSPEYTAALRKALALANGLPVSPEAAANAPNRLSTRGSLDRDSRYRDNFIQFQGQARIWGGEPVPDGLYPDTVAIRGRGGMCTGTVIAPNAVLTAAHCYCDGVSDEVYVGQNINSPSTVVKVSSGKAMIQCSGDLKNGDVAVLVLSNPVTVAPRALANQGLINSLKTGRAVGFGLTANPIVQPAGIKRRVDVPVATVDCSGNVTTDNGLITDSAYYGCAVGRELVAGAPSLDKDSCNGDSGGPFFAQGPDGKLYLAATTSRATGPPGLRPCGDGGIYVRTDGQVVQWIRSLGITVSVEP